MSIVNKKAAFNHTLLEPFEVGVVLSGPDVKAARAGKVNLTESYAKFFEGELKLVNASMDGDTRMRKLLMHKRELLSLQTQIKAKNLVLIPTKMYNTGRVFKVEVTLAKPKKQFEKRASIKQKDIDRDLERELL